MYSEEFNVRFYETDALAHVSNTVLAGWFEAAREPIFRLFTPELDLRNWPLILASYKMDFLQQIFYGHKVEVRTTICRIGSSAFDVHQELWQNQNKCAVGVTTLVHFDFKTNKSKPISTDIVEALQKHIKET
ncbi:thioesterase family protein [uncultured Paraglaciecola sp.]|uniref:acyl-CoA thioesterase n=1 Tax=uncultured Paraglaciecola sp. TaxID=1765024 RepID=UPI002591AA68|nr:thioesterase family protein [uncultured Paraglaciecola sp.]